MSPIMLYPPGSGPVLLHHALVAYGVAGAVFAIVFLAVGLDRVDPGARGSLAFRPLLAPGLVLLWPLVAWRWWGLYRQPLGLTGMPAGLVGRPRAKNDSDTGRPDGGMVLARGGTGLQYDHRAAHWRIWLVLGVVLPMMLLGALALRPAGPIEAAPIRLNAGPVP